MCDLKAKKYDFKYGQKYDLRYEQKYDLRYDIIFWRKNLILAMRISSAMRFKPHSSDMRVISEVFSHIRSLGKGMTRSIFVDSRDRISGTPSNFTILLKRTLNTTDRPRRMRVGHLRLPISVLTLTDQSNVLTVSVYGGASFTSVEMPAQQYDAISFPQIIRDRLTSLVPSRTWNVGYDINRISLTISANGSFLLNDSGSLNRRLKQHPYVDGGNFYQFT